MQTNNQIEQRFDAKHLLHITNTEISCKQCIALR